MRSVSQLELGHESTTPAEEKHLRLQQESQEIIRGIIREGQAGVFCSYYGMGKTPILRDLAFHVHNGLPWLGRDVDKRHVILFDFETSPFDYAEDMLGLEIRYAGQWDYPDAHLLLASESSMGITPLHGMHLRKWQKRLDFVRSLLRRSPNALVIIDPAEHFFYFNRNRSVQILSLFFQLRELLTAFPKAAIFLVMNLRKRGLRRNPPNLHAEPLRWLEDNAGNLDVLNRCDVRIGLDFHDDPTLRGIHGARRRESMGPIIVKQIQIADLLCGFERVEVSPASLELGLTKRQREYWRRLPAEFRFLDIVGRDLVPRSILSRLINVSRPWGYIRLKMECTANYDQKPLRFQADWKLSTASQHED